MTAEPGIRHDALTEPAVPEGVRVHRQPERARYDRATIDAILDASILCHVATVAEDGRPLVLPTLHARVGDAVYLHGSAASPNLRRAAHSVDLSLAVTVLDGLVLAHRVFNHSVNYRSVVVRGRAELVDSESEKLEALRAFTDRLVPGRWSEAVEPDAQELRATTILRLPITEASAKLREGGPGHVEDEPLPEGPDQLWVGVVPVAAVAGPPARHPALPDDVPVSPSVQRWVARQSSPFG